MFLSFEFTGIALRFCFVCRSFLILKKKADKIEENNYMTISAKVTKHNVLLDGALFMATAIM